MSAAIVRRSWPLILVVIASVFVARGMYIELLLPEVHFSDGTFHLSILKNLDFAFQNGRNPLDFWYAGTPFGFALFRSYQYFPYIIIYSIYLITLKIFSLAQVFAVTNIIVAACIPWSFYFGLRAAGLGTLHSSLAAIVSVLISDGGEFGFGLQNYTFGTNGLYTQLWAMAFLPLAIGYGYRYLLYSNGLIAALFFAFMTFGSHVIGAFIIIFSMLLFGCAQLRIQHRLIVWKLVKYFCLLGLLTAHQWIYVFSDALYINRSLLEPAWKYNGRGLEYVINLLWSGAAIDSDRYPVLTVLLLLGAMIGLFEPRGKDSNRFVHLSFWAMMLFFSLYAGREIWGWMFDDMPALKSLHIHRFAIGFHLYAIVLIAGAITYLWGYFRESKILAVAFLLSFVFLLYWPFSERNKIYNKALQRRQDLQNYFTNNTAINDILKGVDPFRTGPVYAGASHNWDLQTKQFGVPAHFFPTAAGFPTVGGALYHAFSLSGETLFDFDIARLRHYELFGIRTIISPLKWGGLVSFNRTASFGDLSRWDTQLGMMHIGFKKFALCGNRTLAPDFMRRWVQSGLVEKRAYGVIAQSECPKEITPILKFEDAVPSFSDMPELDDSFKISSTSDYLPWYFSGKVELSKPAMVILATGYHPNWKATANNMPIKTLWTTPGFLAVELDKGIHQISFEYNGSSSKVFLLLSSILFFVVNSVRFALRK